MMQTQFSFRKGKMENPRRLCPGLPFSQPGHSSRRIAVTHVPNSAVERWTEDDGRTAETTPFPQMTGHEPHENGRTKGKQKDLGQKDRRMLN
jgi:hypothetical protein